MNLQPAKEEDLKDVRGLLEAAGLPTAGVESAPGNLFIHRKNDQIVAAGAIEGTPPHGLIRSVVVGAPERGRGLGRAMTEALIGKARERGFTSLYLLTETAESFFTRMGFEVTLRKQAPESIRSTDEFRSICPESATFMRLRL